MSDPLHQIATPAHPHSGQVIATLSREQLTTLTVREAWRLCGEDEEIFAALVNDVANGIAEYRGLELGIVDAAGALIPDDVETLLQTDGGEPFAFTVGKVVGAMTEHAPLPNELVAAYNTVRECADKRAVCHAPSSSLYFGRNGYVTACCYSRANPLGHWPEQSVAEIWSGEKIGTMRGQMQRNVLPMGCDTCASQLLACNFKGLLAANFDSFVPASDRGVKAQLNRLLRRDEPVPYPIRMEFELSNKCNLECEMCSGAFSSSIRANREGKPPLPQVYDSRFVEQLRPFIPHLKQAKFLGGEPFLIDLYYEIWELFLELNPQCEITITTNGTVFTAKVQRMIERLNFKIVLSLDSVNKPTYETIRRNATMERTLENLDRFTSILHQRGKTINMAVCPMVLNWREIPDLVAFANERGMGIFFNTVTFPESASLKFLPAQELARIAAHLRQGIGAGANDRERRNYRALADLTQQVELWASEAPPAREEELLLRSVV